MERDLPAWWLEEVDQLFTAGDDWQNNACLNYLNDNWIAYLSGYKKAGDVLVEHVIQNRRDQDGLVFPAIFVYRQYLELRLKQLIRDGSVLLDEHTDFPKSHRLDGLWVQCKAILKRVWPDMSDEDVEGVNRCVAVLTNTDSDSTAFRYPTDTHNNLSLSGLRHINLRRFGQVIGEIASILDAAAMGISTQLSTKREMESAYRDLFGY